MLSSEIDNYLVIVNASDKVVGMVDINQDNAIFYEYRKSSEPSDYCVTSQRDTFCLYEIKGIRPFPSSAFKNFLLGYFNSITSGQWSSDELRFVKAEDKFGRDIYI